MALAMDCATLNGFLDRVFPQISGQIRVESVDAQVLIARLLVDEQHLRPGGTVSGPAMFALADVTIYLAILSRIKLFVRPNNLPQIPEDAPGMLTFSRSGNHLKINNPSAYYVTLVNLNVGKTKVDNVMVAPKSDAQVLLPTGVQGNVTFQTVNDYGAVTPAKTVSVR